ncbi:unnamed protein product [Schistosoma curassoni]|uniref:Uncharacterized protein n=1 Tax=Schistosoma curassoni TaxID=6186 RepID=A0A183JV77_9TREM|nr:unnamed protein product [Schistosoma curassoni]
MALKRFNTASLRHTDKLNQLKLTLNTRFQVLQDLLKEETTMQNSWKEIKESFQASSLGRNLYRKLAQDPRKKQQEDSN